MENTRRQKARKRLSILIICTMIMQLCAPAAYGAVTYRTAEARKLITGFTDLPESVKNINVPLGADDATIKNLLAFPETVEATVIEEDLTATASNATTSNADTATESDAAKASDSNTYAADEEEDETADGVLVNDIEVLMDVPVTWELDLENSVSDTIKTGIATKDYFTSFDEAGAPIETEEKTWDGYYEANADVMGAYYTYVAVLPENDEDGNTLKLAEGVKLPELTIVVGMNSALAMSEDGFAGGTGTKDDPYIITTVDHLKKLATDVNDGITTYADNYFRLDAELDLKDINWIPIGISRTVYFGGVFDGNYKTISNMTITECDRQYIGLFGYILDATVKNLDVVDYSISDNRYATSSSIIGGIIGEACDNSGDGKNCFIENCTASGKVENLKDYNYTCVGGVIGEIRNAYVKKCTFSGTLNINSMDSYVGGVIGNFYGGYAIDCSNTGTVNYSGSGYHNGSNLVGGVVGWNNFGTMDRCWNEGKVSASSSHASVGGVMGKYHDSGQAISGIKSHITNCYNKGTVEYNYVKSSNTFGTAGGLIGTCGGDSASVIDISNCFNIGSVSSTDYLGGLIGFSGIKTSYTTNYTVKTTLNNCFYLTDIADQGIGGTPYCVLKGDVEAKTQEQFQSGQITYRLNNSTSEGDLTWGQSLGGDDYPQLDVTEENTVYSSGSFLPCGHIDESGDSGIYSNTKSEIQQPETVGDFDDNGLCRGCGKYEPGVKVGDNYQIKNAGNLAWFASLVNEGTWDGVAKDKYANAVVTADIDMSAVCYPASDGKEAKNWTPIGGYNSTNYRYYGTFDGSNHTISNLYFNSTTNVNSEEGGGNYAGLFGYMTIGSTVKNVRLENVDITGYNHVGGIAGKNFTTNASTVPGTIENCSVSGNVKGTATSSTMVGGIVGEAMSVVKNCYSIADVAAPVYVGGIAGRGYFPGSITNCYSYGNVTGTSNTGGIMGYRYASTVYTKNSYYLSGSVSVGGTSTDKGIGNVSTVDSNNQAIAKIAEEFASGEVAYLLNGGDTQVNPLIWYQNLNVGTEDEYPVLDNTHGIVYKEGDGYVNSAGSLSITKQPEGGVLTSTKTSIDLTVTAVAADSSAEITYQWYTNSVYDANKIDGATSPTYTATTAGTYLCTVSDGKETLTSDAAIVVSAAVSVTSGDETKYFDAEHIDDAVDAAIAGTNSTMTLLIDVDDIGNGVKSGNGYTLNLNGKTVNFVADDTIPLTITDTTGGKVGRLYVYTNVTLSGGTYGEITYNSGALSLAESYGYRYADNSGWVTSFAGLSGGTTIAGGSACLLPVSITGQPEGGEILDANGLKLEVKAATVPAGSENTITYQWYKGSVEVANQIDGATTATYTATEPGDYLCTVICDGYTLTSTVATVSKYAAVVTKDGVEDKKYSNLDDAFNNAPDGSTITMLTDATMGDRNIYTNLTLDLKGKTVTGTMSASHYAISIYNGYSLTIMDSSDDQNGTLTNQIDSISNNLINVYNGTLTVKSGNINAVGPGATAIQVWTGGVANLQGGTVNSNSIGVNALCGNVNISGGYYGGKAISLSEQMESNVQLSGGTFANGVDSLSSANSFLAPGYCYFEGENTTGNIVDGSEPKIYQMVTVGQTPAATVKDADGKLVGDGNYVTLEAALAAANSDTSDKTLTVTVMKKLTIVELTDSLTRTSAPILLDLGGNTVKLYDTLNVDGADVTMKNGTWTGGGQRPAASISAGKLTLVSGLILSNKSAGGAGSNTLAVTGGSVIVDGATIDNEVELSPALTQDNGSVLVKSGTIKRPVYVYQDGTFTVEGEALKGL